MSLWGPGPFDNDDGADWFADIRDGPSFEIIRQAFEEVGDPELIGYIDIADCAEVVAAAEVLAELLGSPGKDPVFDEDLNEVAEALRAELAKMGKRDLKRLLKQAIDALDVVMNDSENSELRQIWEEQDEGLAEWISVMTSLQARLKALEI